MNWTTNNAVRLMMAGDRVRARYLAAARKSGLRSDEAVAWWAAYERIIRAARYMMRRYER